MITLKILIWGEKKYNKYHFFYTPPGGYLTPMENPIGNLSYPVIFRCMSSVTMKRMVFGVKKGNIQRLYDIILI